MSRLALTLLLLGCASVLVGSESDELREKAKAVRKEAATLADRGRVDEAEKLEQHALRLLEAAETGEHSSPWSGGEVPPQFRPRAEELERAGRKLHHLRVAAENLKLAGAQDLTHETLKKAEAMERDIHGAKQTLAEDIRRSQGLDQGHVLQELRAEIGALRAEVRELRERVEHH